MADLDPITPHGGDGGPAAAPSLSSSSGAFEVTLPQNKPPQIVIFEEIRRKLVQEGAISLPLNFPIAQMPDKEELENFLGFCHLDFDKAERRTFVTAITMRLREKRNGPLISLLRLIPTFLHELAHGATELHRAPAENTEFRRRKLKKLSEDHHAHDEEFYERFRRILKAAELLGIYSLPAKPNKYGIQELRRFDQIDLAACSLSLCGTSALYKNETFINAPTVDGAVPGAPIPATPVLAPGPEPSRDPLVLVVCNAKNQKKSVKLTIKRVEGLLLEAKKKFRSKAFSSVLLRNGTVVTDEILVTLPNGSEVVVQ